MCLFVTRENDHHRVHVAPGRGHVCQHITREVGDHKAQSCRSSRLRIWSSGRGDRDTRRLPLLCFFHQYVTKVSLNFESAPATFGERGEWPWRLVLAGHSDFLYMFRLARCTGSSQCTLVFRSKLSLHGGARRSSPTPGETRALSGVWPSRAWSCRPLLLTSMELLLPRRNC